MEAGGTTLHTCSRPLANGPSLPSTEQTLANLTRLGHSHGIDESTLPPVARSCERIAEQEGWLTGAPVEYDAFVYRHQLPGGMTGTLKAQVAQYGMTERLDEVLEECVRVREEFGHPISATPFSQIVGIQAVLNIVTGDRYSMAPDEAVIYLMNAFGAPPAPVDENVRDKVLNSEHGRRFAGGERPQPSLKELRDQLSRTRNSASTLDGHDRCSRDIEGRQRTSCPGDGDHVGLEADGEARPAFGGGLGGDRAAHAGHEAVHEREAHSARADGPVPAVALVQRAAVEHHRVVVRREPGAAVAHLQHPAGEDGERQRRARGGRAQGVLGEAVDDLPQPPRIDRDPHGRPGRVQAEDHALGPAARIPHRARFAGERAEVDVQEVQPEVVGLQPGELHEVADEPVEPGRLGHDRRAGGCDVSAGHNAVGQRLGETRARR